MCGSHAHYLHVGGLFVKCVGILINVWLMCTLLTCRGLFMKCEGIWINVWLMCTLLACRGLFVKCVGILINVWHVRGPLHH